MFPCRVPGCGRALRSLAGKPVHFLAMHSNDASVEIEPPPIHTLCVEYENNDFVMVEQRCDGSMLGSDAVAEANHSPSAASPAGGAVRAVVELPFEVFLEISRALTAHPPSPRRANARRRQPSNSERRARCAIGQARGRRRRRRRRGREGGAVRDERHSGEEGSQERRADGATTPSTGDRDARSGSDAGLEDGDDRDLCDDVFKHYERFGDARKATEAFPQQQGGGEGGGGGTSRGPTTSYGTCLCGRVLGVVVAACRRTSFESYTSTRRPWRRARTQPKSHLPTRSGLFTTSSRRCAASSARWWPHSTGRRSI